MNRRAAEALSNGNTRDGAAGTRSAFSSPRRTRAMPSCSRLRPRAACPSCASSCPARAPSDLPALLGRSSCFARQQIRAARPVTAVRGVDEHGLELEHGGGHYGDGLDDAHLHGGGGAPAATDDGPELVGLSETRHLGEGDGVPLEGHPEEKAK